MSSRQQAGLPGKFGAASSLFILRHRSRLKRYGLAVLLVALTLVARFLLNPFLGAQAPLITFVMPVVVSAWYGGLGPGILATVLGVAVGHYFFVEPMFSFKVINVPETVRLVIFVTIGILISTLSERMHRVQRRVIEQARDLLASEQRFRLLVDAVQDSAIFMLDPDGRIVSWNSGAERIKGYRADEVIGTHFSRFYTPDEALGDKLQRELETAAISGHYEEEGWRVRKDGTRFWAHVTLTAVHDAYGQLQGFAKVTHDITKRKRSEAALRSSEARLGGIIASAMDAIITVNSEQKIVVFNGAAEQMFRCSASEVFGKTLDRFIPHDSRAAHPQYIEGFGKNQTTSRSMHSLQALTALRADGESFPIEATISQIETDGQKLYTVMIRDITERRRAEQARDRYTAMLREQAQLIDLAYDAIMVHDFAGNSIKLWNRGAETVYGWRLDEAIGKEAQTLLQTQFPQPLEEIKAALISVGHWEGELIHVRKDGERLVVASRWALQRDEHGVPRAILEINRDITERARAEQERAELLRSEQAGRAAAEQAKERLAFLAEASAILSSSISYETTLQNTAHLATAHLADLCCIDELDTDNHIQRVASLHANPKYQELADELRQHAPQTLEVTTPITDALRTGKAVFTPQVSPLWTEQAVIDPQYKSLLKRLDAKSAMAIPMIARGRTIGALSLLITESDRCYTTDDLQLAQELANRAAFAIDNARLYQESQDAIRVREVFLSIASHELKTPLTSLLGYTYVLQRRASADNSLAVREQRTLVAITEQGQRLNQLIDSLLDLSRIQQGRFSIERDPVDLCVLARQIVEEFQQSLDHHTLHLQADHESLVVVGDDLRLGQVLQNLLQNAVKYSPSGGPILVRVSRNDDHAELAVTDQGIGIPQAAQPNLFHQFFRASNVDPRQISGLGIGLFVVQQIVELHGGTVSVNSRENVGSTFRVRLPLAPETVTQHGTNVATAATPDRS